MVSSEEILGLRFPPEPFGFMLMLAFSCWMTKQTFWFWKWLVL